MKKLLTGIAVLALTTPAAFAAGLPSDVPEISAVQGSAALAALAAVVLMVWERRRAA